MAHDDGGPSWVDEKKRPRPQALGSPTVEVSRESGLVGNVGTFGKQRRFDDNKVAGRGCSSPYGHLFYSRNQLYRIKLEEDRSCTQGKGERPSPVLSGAPASVGPGLYKIVHSAKGNKSPLDGADFCTTTLKVKLPSALVGKTTPSPGPHAKYEVRGDLNSGLPSYGKPYLSHNERKLEVEDHDGPGPGHYHGLDQHQSMANAASCPNLSGAGERCMEATGGTKRFLKSTFGMADRFRAAKQTCSPQEDRYYAHSKIWDKEDYLNGVRSCSFGACGKTDLSNPYKGHTSQTSPVTYKPIYSTVFPTSPIDGLTLRSPSPVTVFARQAASAKSASRKKCFGHGSQGGSPSSGGNAAAASSGGGGGGDS